MQMAQANIELIVQANMQKYRIEQEKKDFIKEQRYVELLKKYNALMMVNHAIKKPKIEDVKNKKDDQVSEEETIPASVSKRVFSRSGARKGRSSKK